MKFASPSIASSLAPLYYLLSQLFCFIYNLLLLVLLSIWLHLCPVRLVPLNYISVWRLPCRDNSTQIYHVVIDLSNVAKIQDYLLVPIIIFDLSLPFFLTILLAWGIFTEHAPDNQHDESYQDHKENYDCHCYGGRRRWISWFLLLRVWSDLWNKIRDNIVFGLI